MTEQRRFGIGDAHQVTFRVVQNALGDHYTVVDDPHDPGLRCWTCEKYTVYPVRDCVHIAAVVEYLKNHE